MISRGMGTTWARGAATCGGMAVSRFVGRRGAGTHVAREERGEEWSGAPPILPRPTTWRAWASTSRPRAHNVRSTVPAHAPGVRHHVRIRSGT
jgi:hypothetical protein